MGLLTWIVLGLVAGALAKWLMPGKDGGGWIRTILLGVFGAFLGGYGGARLGLGSVTGFDLRSVGLATAGAFVILIVTRKIFG